MITSGYSEIVHTLESRMVTALGFALKDFEPKFAFVPAGGDFPSEQEYAVQFRLTDTPIRSTMWKREPDLAGNVQHAVVKYEKPTQFVEVVLCTKDYEGAVEASHKIVNYFINSKDFTVVRVGNFSDHSWSFSRTSRTFTFEIVSEDFCNNELNTQEIINESSNNWGLNATTISKIG